MRGKVFHRSWVSWTEHFCCAPKTKDEWGMRQKSVFSALSLTWIWGFFVNLIKLFLQTATSNCWWPPARNFLPKGAAKTRRVVITSCYWAAQSSGQHRTLCGQERGIFQAYSPGSVILSPSPCCGFLFLQIHDGSMQKNFCLPLFIWETNFSRLRSAHAAPSVRWECVR